MQALILATNEVEKLSPLSQTIPSALIPLANKPLMGYIIEDLSEQGIYDVIVSLYKLGGSIESYFGTGRRWGVNLRYVLQKDPYGNLGAISRARSLIQDDVLFIPGDVLVNLDYQAILASHQDSKAELTVVTTSTAVQNGAAAHAAQTGVFVISQNLIHEITSQQLNDLERDLLPYMTKRGRPVNFYKADSFKEPLRSFKSYNEIQSRLLQHSVGLQSDSIASEDENTDDPMMTRSKIRGSFLGNGVWVGKNNMIDPSVRFSPPVVIGDNCQIGKDVELGPNVVIGSNVIVDDEATIRNSTIIDYTYIGHLVNVENRFVHQNMIIDNETSTHVQITDPFIIAEAAPRVLNRSLRRVVDTTIAILLLLLFSPLFLIFGLLSLITTGKLFAYEEVFGVTYNQIHKGTKGTPEYFKLIHFATKKRDGTPVSYGTWLEKMEFFRLPELFNIIRGDLSLVGVQPMYKNKMRQLTEDWQFQKFNYSCGFTGLWYVQDPSIVNSESSIIFDIYYVAMRNFRDDMSIFVKTPLTWWSKIRQNS